MVLRMMIVRLKDWLWAVCGVMVTNRGIDWWTLENVLEPDQLTSNAHIVTWLGDLQHLHWLNHGMGLGRGGPWSKPGWGGRGWFDHTLALQWLSQPGQQHSAYKTYLFIYWHEIYKIGPITFVFFLGQSKVIMIEFIHLHSQSVHESGEMQRKVRLNEFMTAHFTSLSASLWRRLAMMEIILLIYS